MHDIDRYLSIIHKHTPQNAICGITFIKDGYVTNEFYKWQHREFLRDSVIQAGSSANIYARITPLARIPATGRGRAADALGSSVLYTDLDCYSNALETLSALQARKLPPTMVIKSGNGLQAFWLLDRLYDDLDTLHGANKQLTRDLDKNAADSCFDLARVLRIPTTWNIKKDPIQCTIVFIDETRVYTLDQFPVAPVDDVIPIDIWDAAPLPADFMENLRERDKKLAMRIKSEDGAKKQEAPIVQSGKRAGSVDRSRNDAYIATRLLGLGYDPATILSVLQSSEWFAGAKYQETGRYDYVVMTVNAAKHAYDKSPDRYFNKNTFVPDRMGQELQTLHGYMHTAGVLWRYVNGVYVPDGEEYIKAELIKRLGKRWSSHASDEILRWMIDQSRVPIETINQHEGLINCVNGMLDIETCTIQPHDPHMRSTIQIAATYDPKVDCTQLDTFLADVLPLDAIPMFWEYVGSCFISNKYWPKAFLALVGPPDSGKSKVLQWLYQFFGGSKNVSAISLQTLADNRFATAALFGKIANIFSDLDEAEAQNTGQIKTLTGGDPVSAEHKFSKRFDFMNTARLIFSSNDYPMVKNPDEAYFIRAKIIPCQNRFIAGKNADPDILQKLSTSTAYSAGLLRALQGLQRLLHHGTFTQSTSIDAASLDYRYSADSVAGFLSHCIDDAEYVISKQQMYKIYRQTCLDGGRRPVSDDRFFKRITPNLSRFNMQESYIDPDVEGGPNRVWCYIGKRPISVQLQPLFMPSMAARMNAG